MEIKEYIPGAISTRAILAYESMKDNLLVTLLGSAILFTTAGVGIERLVVQPHSLQEGGYSKSSSAGKIEAYKITDSEGNQYAYDGHRLVLVPKSR